MVSAAKRRRRRILIIIFGMLSDWYGLLMLCQIWEIYEKDEANLTNPEKDVITAVDNYSYAYGTVDSESFNPCAATEISSGTKGDLADALEYAIEHL